MVNKQFAIENGLVEIVDLPMNNGGSFHSYVTVYQAGYGRYKIPENLHIFWQGQLCDGPFLPIFRQANPPLMRCKCRWISNEMHTTNL